MSDWLVRCISEGNAPREERENENDGLGKEEDERTKDEGDEFATPEALLDRLELVGSPDVLSSGATLLCDASEEDSSAAKTRLGQLVALGAHGATLTPHGKDVLAYRVSGTRTKWRN